MGVVRVLDRVCEKAGFKGVTPHVLRHTFASVAGDLGFSELTIAGLLGHSARGVTQGYVHLDAALRVAADRVSVEIEKMLDGRGAAKNPKKMIERSRAFCGSVKVAALTVATHAVRPERRAGTITSRGVRFPPKAEATGSNPVGRATPEQKRELLARVRRPLQLRISPERILTR